MHNPPRLLLQLVVVVVSFAASSNAYTCVIIHVLSFQPVRSKTPHVSYLNWTPRFPSVSPWNWTILTVVCLLVCNNVVRRLRPQIKFIWHCFLRPIGAADQRTRLDKVCSMTLGMR